MTLLLKRFLQLTVLLLISVVVVTTSEDEAFDEKKSGSTKDGPSSVKVLYSVGFGMQRHVLHLVKFLEDTFPELSGTIDTRDVPRAPTVLHQILHQILPGVQIFAMALILFGDGVWTSMLRFRYVPSWYYPIKAYGIQCSVAVFLVIPKILEIYPGTGAFEIVVDGELAYSKLETGRVPTADDILAVFEKFGLVASKK